MRKAGKAREKEVFKSSGVLTYSGNDRLVVNIDRSIAAYYRALLPKAWNVRGSRHPPHITVVRTTKELPADYTHWGDYEGETIDFFYTPQVFHDGIMYYWINCFSVALEEIRLELGLPLHSKYTGPPSGFKKAFHATIGNTKF